MSTTMKSLGFTNIYVVAEHVEDVLRAIEAEALDRGIRTHQASDALDASRDVILDDATASLGLEWVEIDRALCVYPIGLTVDWKSFLASEA